MRLLLILLIWLGLSPAVHAIETQALSLFNGNRYNLDEYLLRYDDHDSTLSFAEISHPDFEKRFKPVGSTREPLGISKTTFWFKMKLRYPVGAPNEETQTQWYYEIGRPNLDQAVLYIVWPDGRIEEMHAGVDASEDSPALKHKNTVFPLRLALGDEVTLYLKARNGMVTYLPQTLWSPEGFIDKVTTEEYLYGVFYGAMLVMLVFHLMLYISNKDLNYGHYLLYLVMVTAFLMGDQGYLKRLLEVVGITWQKHWLVTIYWLLWIPTLTFVIHFLDMRKYSVTLYYILVSAAWFCGLAAALCYGYDQTDGTRFASIFGGIMQTILFGCALYAWYKGSIKGALYSYAWSFTIAGNLVYFMISIKIIPATPLSLSAMSIGTMTETAVLSLALAEYIKQTRRELIQAKQRAIRSLRDYQSVFHNAIEGIFTTTLGGRLLSANRSMAGLLGYASPEKLLQSSQDVLRPLFHNTDIQFGHLAEQGQWQEDLQIRRDDGETVYVRQILRLARDEEGQPQHIDGTLIDLGERRERARAMKALQRERREKEMAKRLTAAKSTFLSAMNHEIRTPLNAVIGYAELIKESRLDARERRDAIYCIRNNSEQLLQLINNILDYSKIEAGKMTTDPVDMEILPLIDNLTAKFSPQAEARQLGFMVEVHYPLPEKLHCDSLHLSQILTTLCDNAIRYTKDGNVMLDIRWDATRGQLMISVTDHGPGFSNEHLQHLRNQRQINTTPELGGLGLAIARPLAHLGGGELLFDNVPPGGARVRFWVGGSLPEGVTWITEVRRQAIKPRQSLQEIPRLKGAVLVAEDNAVNQKLIQRVIEKTGADVTLVENGKQAIDMLDSHTFDLVLMDVNMPVMDGLEATRILREKHHAGPIYALTAAHGIEEITASLNAGCNGHLTKPLDIPRLYQTLSACLKPRQTPDSGGQVTP